MAEWFVGPVMEKLIGASFVYLEDQVRRQTGKAEELKKLRLIHPLIQDVVSAYSQGEIDDPFFNKWLWQLRDAVDEADDLLDKFEYLNLEKQLNKSHKISLACFEMACFEERSVRFGKCAARNDPDLKRLEAAVHRLYEISAEVSIFLNLFDIRRQQQQQQLELRASIPKTVRFVGRSKEIEFLGNFLRESYQPEVEDDDPYRNISVVSVVGLGGMGKTTLLQHVYLDRSMTTEFDVKIWVRVSYNFDSTKVIANILKFFKENVFDDLSLEFLQERLQSEVMSKRFLLVLDDVWEEDETKWENVLFPLRYGSSGSKILITTRMYSVASTFAKMIKNNRMLRLKGLEEDECLTLLKTHAFGGVENLDDEFNSIAEMMVKNLLGCPLAAKVIGDILNSQMNMSYWTKVLNTTTRKVELAHNYLFPVLKLSYIYLPKYLQNCLAFCCVFPPEHEFDKDDLVRMWIALGFIQSSNIRGETLEDNGRRYFDILIQKSFFDKFQTDDDRVYYKMHDLLYELAQSVYAQECFRVMEAEAFDLSFEIPQTIRHLSIKTRSSLEATFKKLGKFKNLRSLFLSYDSEYDENFRGVLSKIFRTLRSIRLLVISTPNLPKIPETISCLIHLRYLKLDCNVSKLPMSINHLYHLRFMIYKEIHNLEEEDIITNQNFRSRIHLIKDPSVNAENH